MPRDLCWSESLFRTRTTTVADTFPVTPSGTTKMYNYLHGSFRSRTQLSRDYSETADNERKEDITDSLGAIDYQLARLDKQRLAVGNTRAWAMRGHRWPSKI